MKRLQVRCCCRPQKVVGTLPWNEKGTRVRFEIREPRSAFALFDPLADIKSIELEVCPIILEYGTQMLAFKAEDIPIETLRKIPGFEEEK